MLLTLILFSPSIAALLLILLRLKDDKHVRWGAFAASLIPFALSLVAWFGFDSAPLLDGFRYVEQYS
ncbi:MAG: hypothetical protein OEV06_02945, partial [Anaerolineae bacterium]|nr:hypothetical protein [Anaerolineae bacterium]